MTDLWKHQEARKSSSNWESCSLRRGAIRELAPKDVFTGLARHVQGDWGEVGEEDWQENDLSLREGFRLLSSYRGSNDQRFWVITEQDRSATTVLLPEEY